MKSTWIATAASLLLSTAAIAQTTATPAPTAPRPATAAVSGTVSSKATTATSTFTTIPSGQQMTSNVIGLHVHDGADKDIGEIKDISYGPGGVQAYVLGVGGFLEMGEHYVAVSPASVAIAYDTAAKKWKATMNVTPEQLKAAPEFKYPA